MKLDILLKYGFIKRNDRYYITNEDNQYCFYYNNYLNNIVFNVRYYSQIISGEQYISSINEMIIFINKNFKNPIRKQKLRNIIND